MGGDHVDILKDMLLSTIKPQGQILHFALQIVQFFEKSECRIGSEQTVVGLRDRTRPAVLASICVAEANEMLGFCGVSGVCQGQQPMNSLNI